MDLCEICEEYTNFECPKCERSLCKDDNNEMSCYAAHKCKNEFNASKFNDKYVKIATKCNMCNEPFAPKEKSYNCCYCEKVTKVCKKCFFTKHLKFCHCRLCKRNFYLNQFARTKVCCENSEIQNHPGNVKLKSDIEHTLWYDNDAEICYNFFLQKEQLEFLKQRNELLEIENEELKMLITEYELMPPNENGGGPEYKRAKQDFEFYQQSNQ